MMMTGIPFIIGEFFATFISYFSIQIFDSGTSWRIMLGFMAVPVFISFFMNCVYLDESPRVLMIKGKFEQGY